MKHVGMLCVGLLALAAAGGMVVAGTEAPNTAADWHMNATIIEACSCPMFCQCYFNTAPAGHAEGGHGGHGEGGHGEAHYCRFNNAFKVNQGKHGATDLAGIKFWVGGDLGSDFSEGKLDWATLVFDPAVTAEQRQGVLAVLPHLYPVEWSSFTVGDDAAMEWQASADRAEARLDGGKVAEVVLNRFAGMSDEPVVIHNLRYWGAPRNDGFVMMPNEVEAFRIGEKAFEFRGTNGFMITLDIASSDVAEAPAETPAP